MLGWSESAGFEDGYEIPEDMNGHAEFTLDVIGVSVE
jgi:hypothetical protein